MPRLSHRPPRTYRSLQGRWDAIKSSCSRWTACMDQVWAAPPSRCTMRDYVSLLHHMFASSCVCFIMCLQYHYLFHLLWVD
jgi:hypothetical protein